MLGSTRSRSSRFAVHEGLVPDMQMAVSLYLHKEGRERQLPVLSSYKDTTSPGDSTPMTSSKPNYLFKASPPDIIKLGDQGFNVGILGRPKHSVHSTRVKFQGFGFIFIGLYWVRPMQLGRKK